MAQFSGNNIFNAGEWPWVIVKNGVKKKSRGCPLISSLANDVKNIKMLSGVTFKLNNTKERLHTLETINLCNFYHISMSPQKISEIF